MATIGDVAKRAGLSRATVSRVLNDHPYVSEEKKRLVHAVMDELGYVPNSIAQQLRTQTTATIAVIIPIISNPFFGKLVESMEKVAVENKFQLIVCQTGMDKHRELIYLDWLKTKQVGGIILASSENSWRDIHDYMNFGPIMFCNEYPKDTEAPIVCLDQFKGGYIGTRHLLERGYRRIAYCIGSSHETNILDRKKGFEQALAEFGVSMSDDLWFERIYDIEDGRRVFQEIYGMTSKPDAVFTNSDEVAAGMIKEAKKFGYRIPDDLAVIGFDDQPIADLMDPGITTVYQPVEDIGKKTIELMIRYVRDNQEPVNKVTTLPIHLVVRAST
ncbi:MAG TPA: LacI family DNA-binding transcriptional regulator [Bacillales bacterium]|nr:LacI family DNA-binding transcriptional regulator [Bacillales bacterium]